jgi:hypothetical protein
VYIIAGLKHKDQNNDTEKKKCGCKNQNSVRGKQ